jgi:threonine aldolase
MRKLNIDGLKVTQPVQSNGVFIIIPHDVAASLSKEYFFYPWNEIASEYRWMTSWDTTVMDIENFVDMLNMLMNS